MTDEEIAAEEARIESEREQLRRDRKKPVVKPDPTKHIFVDGGRTGTYELMEHPEAGDFPRRLLINGANVEHVGEGENGVWQYRAM